jgi:hypothetical protein
MQSLPAICNRSFVLLVNPIHCKNQSGRFEQVRGCRKIDTTFMVILEYGISYFDHDGDWGLLKKAQYPSTL